MSNDIILKGNLINIVFMILNNMVYIYSFLSIWFNEDLVYGKILVIYIYKIFFRI